VRGAQNEEKDTGNKTAAEALEERITLSEGWRAKRTDVNSRAVGGKSTKHSGSTRSTTGTAPMAIDNDCPGSASR
jgi:hypothetical protein